MQLQQSNQAIKNMGRNRIALNEKNFKKLIKNGLIFDDIKFSKIDLLHLISGEIVEIDNYSIILQDIGADQIFDILGCMKINK